MKTKQCTKTIKLTKEIKYNWDQPYLIIVMGALGIFAIGGLISTVIILLTQTGMIIDSTGTTYTITDKPIVSATIATIMSLAILVIGIIYLIAVRLTAEITYEQKGGE